MQPEVVIVDAVRTPIGRHGGALSGIRPDDLLASTLRALVERNGISPHEIADVYAGCGNQAGEDNRDVARMAALLAGVPVAGVWTWESGTSRVQFLRDPNEEMSLRAAAAVEEVAALLRELQEALEHLRY